MDNLKKQYLFHSHQHEFAFHVINVIIFPPIDIKHSQPETILATGSCAVCKEQKKQILNPNQHKKTSSIYQYITSSIYY